MNDKKPRKQPEYLHVKVGAENLKTLKRLALDSNCTLRELVLDLFKLKEEGIIK